jgi:hypothetical protein
MGGAEHRIIWLQGDAGGERPGVNRVEPEPVDELQDLDDRGGIIARGSNGEATRYASRTAPFGEHE